jgi:AcrR family transcriptional regulator
LTASASTNPFHRPLIELCFERGFAGVEVAELCERAGLDPARFHREYEDLEDCFAVVYEECAEQFLARLEAAFAAEDAWRDGLRAVAHATLAHMQENPARAQFTIIEALFAGEHAQLVRDRVFTRLAGILDHGREQPEAPASLSPNTAESLNGAVFQQMRIAIADGDRERSARLLPELMYAVVLTYLGPEAAVEELELSKRAFLAGEPAVP